MNRDSYEQLLADAKREAIDTLGHNPSPARVQHALDVLVQRVATVTRDFHLANLMGVDEVAQHLGVAPANVRQMLIRRNQRAPLGHKIGKNTWIVDIDELPALERDERKKSTP